MQYIQLKALDELWCEGTLSQMNHCGCGGIFLVWITLVETLAGGHTSVWTFHSARQWCRVLLTLPCVSCTTLTDQHLPGHTHPLNKKEKNAIASLSLDWAEWNNILGIWQSTPSWSDIAAVTREMGKYQTTIDDKKGVDWWVSVLLYISLITRVSSNNYRLRHTCNLHGLLPFQWEHIWRVHTPVHAVT